MRAIGKVEEGQDYYSTTEWSEYSFPVLVTLGPPPAPSSLGVSSKTETSVILSYGPVGGATYQVQYRKTTTDDLGSWDPYPSAMPVTGSTFQVDGLEEGTEYDFQVRTMGDGSRYKAEAGDWSETLVTSTSGTRPISYAAPVTHSASPGAGVMDRIYCGTLPKPELPDDDGSFKQKTTSDGFTYTARAVIAVGVHALRGSQCIEGWLEHTASPGALAGTSWEGKFFHRHYTPLPPNLNRPAWSDSTPYETSHNCATPCEGGRGYFAMVESSTEVVTYQPNFFLYGRHTFQLPGGQTWEPETDKYHQVPPAEQID